VCAFEVSVGDAFAEIPVEILDDLFKKLVNSVK
ncbi:hypothetical protein PY725_14660, partial [Listeria monocytogenes]